MKKSIIFIGAILFANFLPNKTYTCTTIGVTIVKDGKPQTYIKNDKNEKALKKILKDMYSIQIKVNKPTLTIMKKNLSDTLKFAKKIKNLDAYITKDKSVAVFVYDKDNQIGINFLEDKNTIYYQCK